MKHIKLFEENMSHARGLGEVEIAEGTGMMIYNCRDMAFMKERYEEFMPLDQTFEEFVEQMSTPGIYNESEYGGPFEVIRLNSEMLGDENICAMIYRF